MTSEFTEHQVKEFNRLIEQGLDKVAALHVLEGKLEEGFEVRRAEHKRNAERWAKSLPNRDDQFAPVWDCDPRYFYLSMDRILPGDFCAGEYSIVDADVEDVVAHLVYRSARTQGPWSGGDPNKTDRIAYHWAHGLGISPPLVSTSEDKVVIVGGMHRLHLARHYKANRIPLLVKTSEVPKLQAIVKTAIKR
jgi:hypothetical protein